MSISPLQARLREFLKTRSPSWVSAYELRDEFAPNRIVKNIHVHIHRMRQRGVQVQSRLGAASPGYRIVDRPAEIRGTSPEAHGELVQQIREGGRW